MPRRKMAPVDTGAVILFRPAGYTILLFSPVPCPQIGDNLTMQKKYAPIQNNCCIRQPVAVECWQVRDGNNKAGRPAERENMQIDPNTMDADTLNEMIGRQVDREIPVRANGYETNDELDAVINERNIRFEKLVGHPELWNF